MSMYPSQRRAYAACSLSCSVSSSYREKKDRRKSKGGKLETATRRDHKKKGKKERMVRIGPDSSKKGSRHVRYDDIPTDTFTPRTYQVELLESALHGNTIACLGSESSKVFLGLMVLKELAYQVRPSLEEGGKRSIYLVDSEEEVESLWTTMFHHTDLAVGRVPSEEAEIWSAEQWTAIFASHNILVLSASVFLRCLDCRYLSLTDINLLVLDDCHKAVGDHGYVSIMAHVTQCKDSAPQLLCLTASILGSECNDPKDLAARISSLEATLHSKAETSMLVISERFGCRPKESVIECKVDDDVTGMGEQLASILHNAWHFLEDCNLKLEDYPSKSDPLHVPKFAISECINILQTLGSWCAASIAENLISQLEKIVKHESNSTLKLFLRYTITQLRMVVRVFEIGFTPDYVVDELLSYTTPKVREFVNVLRKYKPEMDFMIITREGEEDESMSDLSDDDGNDDDSFDLSSSDEEDSKEKCKHIHIAVKKKEKGSNDSSIDEEKKLSGLVFVDNRYVAFALNKMMEEVCSWDENLCFVKSSHITGQGIHRSDGRKDLSNASRKQEEVLRKFRMQERNLLISTSVLEEGVDIPKCNLVVRFDPPRDYRSYALSKGRARAREAEYVILVDEEIMEDFSDEIQIFKGIEEVLIGAGRGRQDLEDAQQVQQLEQLDFIPLPPFCPLSQPDAATVTMKNAISLINRYCAKLPSDAFTHLTPQCRVTSSPDDDTRFVAYLRLPVNSPIKEELKGAEMPSRQLAKMAVALQMCELLYNAGELDCHLQPVGKEMFVCEEEEEWEEDEDESIGQARPGTTKRKQYYTKKPADAFVSSRPKEEQESFLYYVSMTLTGPITEEQNTRGRKIYAPENSMQSFGILLSSEIPHIPSFPVYTRSGEVTVSVELLKRGCYSEDQLEKLIGFHHFVFSSVLHLEKDPMIFSPFAANIGLLIVPLNNNADNLDIEWSFVEEVNSKTVIQKGNVFDGNREMFSFERQQFEDAVVMPSYRNMDQPQHFYVAEIRSDLSPLSPFPSPELYKTFAAYYTTKYGLTLTNMDQPLLDVDHTSARLNLLTPRYMNQKGRALPTSSLETKRARRENLQQKQILVPELCDIHIFSASLWRKAVCLPAILYRMNYLLLAEELRKLIAAETGIGKVTLDQNFRFPRLDFGFETNPEKLQLASRAENESETERKTEAENGKDCNDGVHAPSVQRESHDDVMRKGMNHGEEAVSEAKGCKDHSSAEDDKTDTGASSDSDSGVVLNECEASCTTRDSASAGTSEQCAIEDHNTCSETNLPSATVNSVTQNNDNTESCMTLSPKKLPTDTDVKSLGNVCVDHVVLGDPAVETSHDDDCDAFVTPSTSRPPSPADSEHSVYEDAPEFVLPSTTTLCSKTLCSSQCNSFGQPCIQRPSNSTSSPQEDFVCNCAVSCQAREPSSQHQPSSPSISSCSVLPQSAVECTADESISESSSHSQVLHINEFPESSGCMPTSSSADNSSSVHQVPDCSHQASPTPPASDPPPCEQSNVLHHATFSDLSQVHSTDSPSAQGSPAISLQALPSSDCESGSKIGQKQSHDDVDLIRPSDKADLTLITRSTPLSKKNSETSQCVVEECEDEEKVDSKCVIEDCKEEESTNSCDVEDCKEEESTNSCDVEDCKEEESTNSCDVEDCKEEESTNSCDVEDCKEEESTNSCDVEDCKEEESTNSCNVEDCKEEESTNSCDVEDCKEEESTNSCDVEDCDDFLDVTGCNRSKTDPRNKTITFPGNVDVSGFSKHNDHIRVTFESVQSVDADLDVNWACTTSATVSGKDWAPDEHLSTFEVNDSSVYAASTDHNSSATENPEKVCVMQSQSGEGDAIDLTVASDDGYSSQPCQNRDVEQCSYPPQKDSSVPCLACADETASTETLPQNSASCPDTDNQTTHDTGVDTQGEPEWGGKGTRHPSEWSDLLHSYPPKPRIPQEGHENLKQVHSVSVSAGPFTRESQVSEKDDSPSTNVSDDVERTSFPQADISHPTGADGEQSLTVGDRVAQPETAQGTDVTVVTEVNSDSVGHTGKQEICAQDGEKTSAGTITAPKASGVGQQFEIGQWNEGQKRGPEGADSARGHKVEEEKVESSPLLISLDEDTDLETFMGPSPCLLLQALTMSNANDFFSLERLETIGDSFLKYAITVYLYCCYPGTHEGKLSYLRSKQVSNYNLYRLGRRKGLAERMVSTKFEPYENWLPPGYIISEDRRRGPVPKVVIATSNSKLSAAAPVNFVLEEEDAELGEDQKKETEAFQKELEEIDHQQAVDQQNDISSSCHKHAMIPYCLQLHHGIPDKSVADCVEALIGCYLTTCGKQAALTFMSWLGLKVLPRKRVVKQKEEEEVKMTVFQELQCPPSPLLTSVPQAPQLLNRLLEGFEEFEAKIEYTFNDRSYLLQAFTHASYHYNYITDCYQRLEFLGDAILDYVITRHLYEDSRRYSPGILTDLRSALVNNNIFAALAVKWDFHKFFKAISPSLFVVIDKFVVRQKERQDEIDEIEEVKKPKKLETDDEDEGDAEGREATTVVDGGVEVGEKEEEVELEIPKALGDIFESVAGAIYLDSGMSLDAVWTVYFRMMKPHIDKYLKDIPKSPVRELLEMEPETAKFEKPERTLEGKIRVTVNVVGKGVFYGVGRNYRIAKSAAAKKALRFIRNLQMEGQV